MGINWPIRLIMWDWNGTILNDIDICIEAMNRLLAARNLPLLNRDRYIQIFTFPVKDYYQAAGFNFSEEPFEKPAMEFMDHYFNLLPTAKLNIGCIEALDYFKSIGMRQIILSAMEQVSLNKSLVDFGLQSYFEHVSGSDNHYAHGKASQAIALMKKLQIKSSEALLIGDTQHDYEVAETIGCQCVLIASGHQDEKRLQSCPVPVLKGFGSLSQLFENQI